MRLQLPPTAPAMFYRVDRSTITRAVHEIRPPLAQRGFAVPGHPDLRLHTLADVFAYAAAEGVHVRGDGTELQTRRPRTTSPAGGRSSRARKENTINPTAISDDDDRLLWLGTSPRAECTT